MDWLAVTWPWVVGAINLAAALAATTHAVLRRRDSRAVIGWAGLIWLAPLVGALAYACLGVNRISRKGVSLGLQESWTHRRAVTLTADELDQRTRLAAEYPQLAGLARLGRRLTGRPLLPGNEVVPLINGDATYPAMLAALDAAEASVALSSYIFDNDQVGRRFLERLVDAQDRGVQVRVLVDHVGARYSRPTMVKELRARGIPVATFLPTRTPRLFRYANLRNHRKILVVDGRIGFAGGTNIREGHWLALQPTYPVQCLHFQLRGPIVNHLQEAFAIDWAFASGESLHGAAWFPRLARAGSVWARGIPDGPDEDFEKITDMLHGALAAAAERVRIVTPYFLPEASLIRALNVAAMSGVEVEIVLPSKNNIPLVHWAAMAQLWQLLEKGCRVYLTPPPFDHTKLMIVDDVWSLVGSSNWDPRSLRLNFEYNVECYDRALAAQLSALVDAKLSAAREITLQDVQSRSFPVQLRDGLARLAMPYL